MLRREQLAEAFIAHPHDWRNLAMSRMDKLRERYDIASTALIPAWERPLSEPPAFRAGQSAKSGVTATTTTCSSTTSTRCATTPRPIAPSCRTSRVSGRQALDFRHTYSAGSDTLRALPALTSGSYEIRRAARERPVERSAAVAVADRAGDSAVRGRVPAEAEAGLQVRRDADRPDYASRPHRRVGLRRRPLDRPAAGRPVAGVGEVARTSASCSGCSTSTSTTGGSSTGLRARHSAQLHVPDEGPELALPCRRDGHRCPVPHGLLLGCASWTCRPHDRGVRGGPRRGPRPRRLLGPLVFLGGMPGACPLMIRIPGVAPRAIDDKVSLVDVAPTLARYLETDADTKGYQGEDLLGYLVPHRPPRRLPLLMSGASKENLVRVGIVRPNEPWKLVAFARISGARAVRPPGGRPRQTERCRGTPRRDAASAEPAGAITDSSAFPR